MQVPEAGFTFFPLIVRLVDLFTDIHVEQFFSLQGFVGPCLFPRAKFLTLTSLFYRLLSVFFTNWNSCLFWFGSLSEGSLSFGVVRLLKLLVLLRSSSYILTVATMSVSLPNVKTTLTKNIFGILQEVVVSSDFFLSSGLFTKEITNLGLLMPHPVPIRLT